MIRLPTGAIQEFQRHPFFYEPTLVTMAALIVSVMSRAIIARALGPLGWLWTTAAGVAIWAFLRLVPLKRYVADEDRDRRDSFRSIVASPILAMVLGFAGAYVVFALVGLALPLLADGWDTVGRVGGVVVGLPLGASYWIGRFGYAARRERARRARSRPSV